MRLLVSLVLISFIGLATAQPDASLLPRLRQGGYVLYMRHASTDFSQDDARMTSYEDCSTQRNLTDKGRAEARRLGSYIKNLEISIGAVYASPFCRTMGTVRLPFAAPIKPAGLPFANPNPTKKLRGGRRGRKMKANMSR